MISDPPPWAPEIRQRSIFTDHGPIVKRTTGAIADAPADVEVRVAGEVVSVEAVYGLLGQIVLAAAPATGLDVKVDYAWIDEPTVDVRRLNSPEFLLNSSALDHRLAGVPNGHQYRYKSDFVRPGAFEAARVRGANATLDGMDLRVDAPQPLQRDIKYRAFERAYTASLNDPTTLLLNAPTHQAARPPLSREVEGVFVNYQATTLPEADVAPWVRHGGGEAALDDAQLRVTDDSGAARPTGQGLFWTKRVDLTFPCVFAMTWRMAIRETVCDGVFSGVVAGYSDEERVVLVGYLVVAGVRRIGILRRGDWKPEDYPGRLVEPSKVYSWVVATKTTPSGSEPLAIDWTLPHSYRLFHGPDGNIGLFLDGSMDAVVQVVADDLPTLDEVNAPFIEAQGVIFGSVSNEATSESLWTFVRYLVSPINPQQTASSVSVAYEANELPEAAAAPWIPVGFHGVETVSGGRLQLDSTSADDTVSGEGLIGAGFKGYVRIEPLLAEAYETTLDVAASIRTHTHGVSRNAVTAAIDDGTHLMQLSLLAHQRSPKLSYGGGEPPEQFSDAWVPQSLQGLVQGTMYGQHLLIQDGTTLDGLVYSAEDSANVDSVERIASPTMDYCFEFRVLVQSESPDPEGFAGVMVAVDDGLLTIGVQLRVVSGQPYVALYAANGSIVGQWPFPWRGADVTKPRAFHTYRVFKSTLGNLVSLYVDNVKLGDRPYTGVNGFGSMVGGVGTGIVSFGSATTASHAAQSSSLWAYVNCWRVQDTQTFVGLWRGTDPDQLCGYHLPLRVSGDRGTMSATTLNDGQQDFVDSAVAVGDAVVVDDGPNKGSYTVVEAPALLTPSTLKVRPSFPSDAAGAYRVVKQIDWTAAHRYRVQKRPQGGVGVYVDDAVQPLIECRYSASDLPASAQGIGNRVAGGLPNVFWGALDPDELSQTIWDSVRYQAARSAGGQLGSEHQLLNQRNVIASYEHHRTHLPHVDTDHWSSSNGVPTQIEPDLLRNASLMAHTILNEGTPLVIQTQSLKRGVPDVTERETLYTRLRMYETGSGVTDLLAPVDDGHLQLGEIQYQRSTCFEYTGAALPLDADWVNVGEDPDGTEHQIYEIDDSRLLYGTDSQGTRVALRHDTHLLANPSLHTEVKFRLAILQDATEGVGDSQVRVGFSAPGISVGLAFVTTPIGERYVEVVDMNNGQTVGGIPFDFYDGAVHTYRLVRNPVAATVDVYIDA